MDNILVCCFDMDGNAISGQSDIDQNRDFGCIDMIKSPHVACCQELNFDIQKDSATHNLEVIAEARKVICNLTEKYGTGKSIQSLQRIIDVKKTRIWEILCDSRAKKLKGFGIFLRN